MNRSIALRWTSIVLALIGLADSVYLSWLKLANQVGICSTIGDCESVNNSAYSEVAGIPIALFGAGAYLVILLVLVFENRIAFFEDHSKEIIFGLTFFGVVYSAWLTYVEIAILRAICPFCVISAITLLVLFVLAIVRLFQAEPEAVYSD